MIYHTVHSLRILDLFSGSGAVGIAALMHLPAVTVDFADIEPRHFDTIAKSLAQNGIDAARTRFIETDVWSAIDGRYDAILANPPYLAEGSQLVEESVTSLEPREALYATDKGFALINATLRGARDHLAPDGTLWLEHDPEQAEQVATVAHESGLTVETHTDQYGRGRYTVAYCGG